MKRHKVKLMLMTTLSLLGVFISSIVTAAWFQIEKQEPETTMVSGSSNMAIQQNDITGYKIEPPVGANGLVDYSVTNVTKAKGKEINIENPNKDEGFTNYDVPTDGAGYYLIKQNESGTYTYKVGETSYSTKFDEYDRDGSTTTSKTAVISTAQHLEVGEKYRVRYYGWDSKTIHHQNIITSCFGAGSSIDGNGDVEIGEEDDYKIWIDYTDTNDDPSIYTCTIGFEKNSIAPTLNDKVLNVRSKIGPKKEIQTGNTKSKITDSGSFSKVVFQTTCEDWTADYYLNMWKNDDSNIAGHGYPGLKVGRQLTSSNNTQVYDFTPHSNFSKFDRVEITRFDSNSNSSDAGTYVTSISGSYKWNSSGTQSFTANASNFYKVTAKSGSSLTVSIERRSTLSIYFIEDNNTPSFQYSIDLYNDQYIKSAMTEYGKDMKPTISGKQRIGWYKDAACTQSYNFTSDDGYMAHDGALYCKFLSNITVTRFASLFVLTDDNPTGTLIKTVSLTSQTVLYDVSTTITACATQYETDNTNGISYAFSNPGNKWYTNSTCTLGETSTVRTTSTVQYYAKMVADLRSSSTTHKMVYLDLNGSDWEEVSASNIKCRITDNSYTAVTGVQVAPLLYRFILSNSSEIQFTCNNGSGNAYDYSSKISGSTISGWTYGKSIIHIQSASGVNHGYKVSSTYKAATNYGEAVIEYYNTAKKPSAGWDSLVTMHPGDGTGNKFVYEQGKAVALGTELRLKHTINAVTTYYGNSHYLDSLPFYLTEGSQTIASERGKSIKTVGYVGNAELNFYFTLADKLVVTMVPEKGNGYYIMNYEGSSWDNAASAYKMQDATSAMSDANKLIYSYQGKAVIDFNVGDTFKFRSNVYPSLAYENDGAISGGKVEITSDDNKNLKIKSGYKGKYVIYLKVKKDGTGCSIYIATATGSDLTYEAISPDSSFVEGTYYVVGSTNLSTGTSTPTSSSTGFFGGKKMSMTNNESASYNGYYARSGEQIFIRSYLDAVDKLYTESGTGSSTLCGSGTAIVSLNSTTGVITFGSTAQGYYNIFVYKNRITVEPLGSSEFFRLNPLNTSNTSTRAAVFNQKTALVLEIPFICNNSYSSKISLGMANVPSYVGAVLYCSLSQLPDPYGTLHDGTASSNNYYKLASYTAGDRINDCSGISVPANRTTPCYAYILIDYLHNTNYGTLEGEVYVFRKNNSNNMQFYLTATQV